MCSHSHPGETVRVISNKRKCGRDPPHSDWNKYSDEDSDLFHPGLLEIWCGTLFLCLKVWDKNGRWGSRCEVGYRYVKWCFVSCCWFRGKHPVLNDSLSPHHNGQMRGIKFLSVKNPKKRERQTQVWANPVKLKQTTAAFSNVQGKKKT